MAATAGAGGDSTGPGSWFARRGLAATIAIGRGLTDGARSEAAGAVSDGVRRGELFRSGSAATTGTTEGVGTEAGIAGAGARNAGAGARDTGAGASDGGAGASDAGAGARDAGARARAADARAGTLASGSTSSSDARGGTASASSVGSSAPDGAGGGSKIEGMRGVPAGPSPSALAASRDRKSAGGGAAVTARPFRDRSAGAPD